jgi:hypothetical protein
LTPFELQRKNKLHEEIMNFTNKVTCCAIIFQPLVSFSIFVSIPI